MTWTDLKGKIGKEIFLNAVTEARAKTQKYKDLGIPLAVQWLGTHTFTAKGLGSITCRES